MGSRTRRVVRGGTSDELSTRGQRSSEEVDTASDDMPFVRLTRSSVTWAQAALRRVKTAVIGPDFTGNPRGDRAFDIQTARGAVTDVAAGDQSVAMGNYNEADGLASLAIGVSCKALSDGAVALGQEAKAVGAQSLAIGIFVTANNDEASALGVYAEANIARTINLGGAVILHKGVEIGGVDWLLNLSAVECILSTPFVDLKTVAEQIITLPAGCKFFLTECGIVLTHLTALTTQPMIRFGVDGSLAASLSPFLTTDLTAIGARERFLPDNRGVGVTSLSFGVTVAAVATTLKGRAYWKGVLIEDEA